MSAPDLLRAIVAATRRTVAERAAREPMDALERRALRTAPRGEEFEAALRREDRVNVIAECKRRSPSKGVLAEPYHPARIAVEYERGGAAAVSVLTEPAFFDGTLEHLEAVRAAVRIPVLRKDFVVEEYQLLEARAAGADAVLLIVAALDEEALRRLLARALALGLAALVEVHEEDELRRALDAGARLVGVNNRNLRTLTVDVTASSRLATRIPAAVTGVSESGLRTRGDVEKLRAEGYRAFLIGERFMTAPNPGAALAELTAVGTS